MLTIFRAVRRSIAACSLLLLVVLCATVVGMTIPRLTPEIRIDCMTLGQWCAFPSDCGTTSCKCSQNACANVPVN